MAAFNPSRTRHWCAPLMLAVAAAAEGQGHARSAPLVADCLVIGSGVVGLAVARQLALLGRSVHIVEKTPHICMGVSSGNSGLGHTGYDARSHAGRSSSSDAGVIGSIWIP